MHNDSIYEFTNTPQIPVIGDCYRGEIRQASILQKNHPDKTQVAFPELQSVAHQWKTPAGLLTELSLLAPLSYADIRKRMIKVFPVGVIRPSLMYFSTDELALVIERTASLSLFQMADKCEKRLRSELPMRIASLRKAGLLVAPLRSHHLLLKSSRVIREKKRDQIEQ